MDPEEDLDIWKIFKIVIGIDFYSEHVSKSNAITDDTMVNKGKINPTSKLVILKDMNMPKSSDCIFTIRRKSSRKVLCELYGRSWNKLMKDDFNMEDFIYCEEVARYLTITYNTRKECVGKWLGMIKEIKIKNDSKEKRTNQKVRKRPNENKTTNKVKRPRLTEEEKSRRLLERKLNRKRRIPDISLEENKAFIGYIDLMCKSRIFNSKRRVKQSSG